MTPRELIADLRSLGLRDFPPEVLSRVLLNFLADHVYDARLGNGSRLIDATDFVAWLRELAVALNSRPLPMGEFVVVDHTCPRCGHVHEGFVECGADMGNGRICRCEVRIAA